MCYYNYNIRQNLNTQKQHQNISNQTLKTLDVK